MTIIAFSGSRYLPVYYQKKAIAELEKYKNASVIVGDAKGLDELVRQHLNPIEIYKIKAFQRWAYAERSQRMINNADKLVAFPLKPCPPSCHPAHPFSGHGSGTWGTIAYAKKKGLPIEIIFLDGQMTDSPSWLTGEPLPKPQTGQLNLF